jgi:hypothetical protein
MSQDPHAHFDQLVLEMIEHSPVGAVPHTPTYQDALRRLYASHQVYASADHKDGHVTARSLAALPSFHAANLEAWAAGAVEASELEDNTAIFNRYIQSLPAALQAKAETFRLRVVGRPILHRKHGGTAPASLNHDPLHSLFLVPGTGPRHGLPGNYLHGSLCEVPAADSTVTWTVQLHDADDGAASCTTTTNAEALEKVQEVIASAPFDLSELEALGFTLT